MVLKVAGFMITYIYLRTKSRKNILSTNNIVSTFFLSFFSHCPARFTFVKLHLNNCIEPN